MTEIKAAQALMNQLAKEFWDAKDSTDRREVMVAYLDALVGMILVLANHHSKPEQLYWEGPYPRFSTYPIVDLQEALLQLNNRETPVLLSKPRKAGKPLVRKNQYGYAAAAAAMTLLIKKFGRSKNDAAKKVVDVWNKNGRSLPGRAIKSPAPKRLIAWRDKCMSGKYGAYAEYALLTGGVRLCRVAQTPSRG